MRNSRRLKRTAARPPDRRLISARRFGIRTNSPLRWAGHERIKHPVIAPAEPLAVGAQGRRGHPETPRIGERLHRFSPFIARKDVVAIMDYNAVGNVSVQPFNLDIVDKTVVITKSGFVKMSSLVNINTVHPRPRKNSSFF